MKAQNTGSATRRWWGLVWVVLLLALVVFFVEWPATDEGARQNAPATGARVANDAAVASSRAHTSVASSVISHAASVSSVALAVSSVPSLWQIADESPEPTLPLPEAVSIYRYVAIDMDNPALPMVGERISLPLPEAPAATIAVARAASLADGSYTLSGYMEGQGRDYPAVITYGANSVFATITTPDGSYSLETIAGEGWVYKNPAEAELSEPHKDDFLEVPEGDGLHHHH